MLALLSLVAAAAEVPTAGAPPPDLHAEAKRLQSRGALEVGLGTALMGGAVAVLLVREGEPGAQLTDPPPQWVLDLRSAGGAVMLIGGFTTVLVGGRDLGRAAGLRSDAAQVTLAPAPNGIVLSGRF